MSATNIGVAHQDKHQQRFGRFRRCFLDQTNRRSKMKKINSISKPVMWSMTVLFAAVVAGCGGSSSGSSSILGATGSTCSGTGCVNLGTAANYAILASTGVSTVPNSAVTGNVGLSPAARTFLTGWSETYDATDTYATSAQVTGKLFAADLVGGTTSAQLTAAVGDMQTAYTNAKGMALAGGGLTTACPGVGILDNLTITPGVYSCTTQLSLGAGTNVTLSGAGVYVIRTTFGLTQAAGTQVLLTGGAVAENVFWVFDDTVSIGGTAGGTTKMAGVILAKTNIVVGTNATVNGRLLAQTAVTLDQSTITQP